jgi:hypothetical protein
MLEGLDAWKLGGCYQLKPESKTLNPDKPEKKMIFYHETTKVRNHEKDHENFRVFQFSCFRD